MALGAQLSGVLNTWKKFALAAFAPTLLNVFWLFGFLWIWFNDIESQRQMTTIISWCIFAAGWAQMIVLFMGVKRKGINIRLTLPKLTPKMKQLFFLMVPGIGAASVQQINLLVGRQIASTNDSSISYLYNADRLNQFPLGMIGIALGISLLPTISRLVASKDWEGASKSLEDGIKIGLLLTIPAAIALAVIPFELMNSTFGYGKVTDVDVREAAKVLAGFAIGLPAYVLIKVLQTGFFARKDTKRPMKYGIIMVIVNLVFSFMLFPVYKHVGLAIATSIAGWVNVVLLLMGLRGFFSIKKSLVNKLFRMTIASLLMSGVVFVAAKLCNSWIIGEFYQRLVALTIIVGLGLCTYALAALVVKATSISELKGYMRRS